MLVSETRLFQIVGFNADDVCDVICARNFDRVLDTIL